jgi:hypothetical protein
MHAEYRGPNHLPTVQWSCSANFSGVKYARQWGDSLRLSINSSELSFNMVGDKSSSAQYSKAFGAAIYAVNVEARIHSSSIYGNRAVGNDAAGAGISLESGTSSLYLGGDTTISNNTCVGGDNAGVGASIYSAAGGAIIMRDKRRGWTLVLPTGELESR